MAKPIILLVDNSKFYLELEKAFLRRTDAMLLTAETGMEALAQISGREIDLIYMELDLPELDGAACCRRLKQSPIWKNIPVILIYDRTKSTGARICREAGCDSSLKKPLDRILFLMEGKRFLPLIDRRTPRIACRQLVVVRHGNDCFCGTSADLSVGGMYVGLDRNDQPLHRDDVLYLSFVMPGTVSDLVEITGRVAWLNHGHNRPKPSLPDGCGLEFINELEAGRKLIQNYLGHRLPC